MILTQALKFARYKQVHDRCNNKNTHNDINQRCDLCNVPILNDLCTDERSIEIFNGKGEVLCKKCANFLSKIPARQALQALNNAAHIYARA